MLYFVYQQKKSYNLSPPANGTVCHLQLWLRRTRTITLLSFLPIFLMVEKTQLGNRRSGTVSLLARTVILLHHRWLFYHVAGERICIKIRVFIKDKVDDLRGMGGPHQIWVLCKDTKGVEVSTYYRWHPTQEFIEEERRRLLTSRAEGQHGIHKTGWFPVTKTRHRVNHLTLIQISICILLQQTE